MVNEPVNLKEFSFCYQPEVGSLRYELANQLVRLFHQRFFSGTVRVGEEDLMFESLFQLSPAGKTKFLL